MSARHRSLTIGNSHLMSLFQADRPACEALIVDEDITRYIPEALSHRAVLRRPLGELRTYLRIGPRAVHGMLVSTADGVELSPDMSSELRRELHENKPDLIISTLFGESPSVFGMPEHPVPFDYFDHPDDLSCGGDGAARQVLPASVACSQLRENTLFLIFLCTAIRQLAPHTPMVHVLAPPPSRDPLKLMSEENPMRAAVLQHGIAPLALRLRIYRSYCSDVVSQLGLLGIHCLGAPGQSTDAEGALLPQFEWDSVHANASYGQMVLDQLEALT